MCKKRNFNKLLSVFLSVLMLTSFLQTAVSATGSDGTESTEAVTFTAIDGTAGASNAGGRENFDKLMDGSVDTKWCVTNFTTAYIVIEATQAVSISGYQMTTGDDTARETSRNPEDWTLYGCNDYDSASKAGTWEVIHEVIGDPVLQNVNKTAFSFACDKTETPYKYYKLLITKNSGSEKCMQLSEFNFTFCEHVTTVSSTRDADCTNYAYIEKNCSVCGLTYKMITARENGHTWVTQSTTAATCTQSGTLSQKCSVCNATQTINDPDVPALGHTWETVSTTDATCTQSGRLSQKCSVCNATQTINDPDAPALGHTWETVSTTDATCEENGKINQECSVCKATQTINDPDVPALGHNFVDGTCTNCTRTDLECTQSPHSYPDNYNKTWTITREGAVKIAITFSENTKTEKNFDFIYIYDGEGTQIGKYDDTKLAGQTVTVTSDVVKIRFTSDRSTTYYGFSLTDISAEYTCGHSDVNLNNYTPASCNEDGYSGDVYCNTCNAVVSAGKTLAATGHNFIILRAETAHPHPTTEACVRCGAGNTGKTTLDNCFECDFNFTEKTDKTYKVLSYVGSVKVVSIPASYEETAITEIGTACFKGNKTITEVVIPDSVTSIGSLAFMGCSNLSKVTIPASVTSIGTQAFYGFTGTIYCEKGSYAYEYAVANNIKYAIIGAEASEKPIKNTENTTIDYTNHVIYTVVENSSNIADILALSDSAIVVPTASYAYGDIELYGTGTVITVFNGGAYVGEFTLIVSGDVNGDSVCDVIDCSVAQLAANGHMSLEGAYKTAADANSDGTVDASDYQATVNRAVS